MTDSAPPVARFFVTPQAANLMQDMHRQLMQGGDICVLHGAPGCGKSQLLRHFIGNHLAASEVLQLVLHQEGFSLDAETVCIDYAEFSEKLLELLPSKNLLLIDQLENGDDKLCEELLRFWQVHGLKLDCRLLLCSSSAGLKKLAAAAEKLRVPLLSIELKPWGDREVLQYLQRRLCPSVEQELEIDRDLKRQIRLANGLPGYVEQIAQRMEGRINCRSARGHLAGYMIAASLVGVVLLLLLGVSPELQNRARLAIALDSVGPSGNEQATSQGIETGTSTLHQAPGDKQIEDRTPDVKVDDFSGVTKGPSVSRGSPSISSVSLKTRGPAKSSVADSGAIGNALEQRISATDRWLARSNGRNATVQLMSVVYRSPQAGPLNAYLNELASAGVDIEKIFVYRLDRESSYIFVVLFGEYGDRREANRAIQDLPQVLAANNPIPRSVNSIKAEIAAQQSGAEIQGEQSG